MPLDQNDLRQIKEVVVEAVDPYFTAIQKDFTNVYDRLDRIDRRLDHIEQFLLEDHRKRIANLEEEVKALKELFAVK